MDALSKLLVGEQGEVITKCCAEIERLRALIEQAESVECYCPWCGSTAIKTNLPRTWRQKQDCPAFTPEGEVR